VKIKRIKAIEILDSRGNPTIKSFVELENGLTGSACIPSGASTGTHEAAELRDDNKKRYLGKGVLKAIENVNSNISKKLTGASIENIQDIDLIMIGLDGTENKTNLGANAILSVSLATARTLAFFSKKPLWKIINEYYFTSVKPGFPRLFVNVVNGGKHADWNFDIQEFVISPVNNLPSESVRISSEIFHHLAKKLKEKNLSILVGDEGGYSPALNSNDEVFEYLLCAIQTAGYSKQDINLGIDAAASEFYNNSEYTLKKNNKKLSPDQLIEYYMKLNTKYGVRYFEDAFAEDDWISFAKFTHDLKNNGIVIGDDLYCTNPKRIKRGIKEKTTTAVLIKVNQIGSLFETVEAIRLAQQHSLQVFISHRSGETEDSFIADLAYGCGADFIKTGSMSRSERIAKYNRLLEIEAIEVNH